MTKNTVIYLIGFPGTGKYTVAKEICKQCADFRLVDNHLINNPVFSVIHTDGKTPLPERVWKNTIAIWDAVLDTLKYVSPKEYSFVLTNVLFESKPDNHEHFKNIMRMAETRNALFVPVCLACDVEENERRIVSADRADRMKETDVTAPRKYVETQKILNVDHPNLLTLDVTKLSPEKSAEIILMHTKAIGGSDGRPH